MPRANQVDRGPGHRSNICGDYGNQTRLGEPCRNWCIPGADWCRRHLPKEKGYQRVLAEGVVVKEISEWGLRPGDYPDPGELFLQLIAQSSRRVQRYAELLGQAVELAARAAGPVDQAVLQQLGLFDPNLPGSSIKAVEDIFAQGQLAGLTAPTYELDVEGARVKVGEQIRALVKLEAEERERLATWCQKAIAAGLEERRVRLAEAAGANLAAVIRAFTAELGLSEGQRELVPDALRRAVAVVFGETERRQIEAG